MNWYPIPSNYYEKIKKTLKKQDPNHYLVSYFSVIKNKTSLTKTEVDAQLELCWPEYPNHPIHVLYTNKHLSDIKILLTQVDDEEKPKIIDEDSYIINGSHYVTKDSLYTIDQAKKENLI